MNWKTWKKICGISRKKRKLPISNPRCSGEDLKSFALGNACGKWSAERIFLDARNAVSEKWLEPSPGFAYPGYMRCCSASRGNQNMWVLIFLAAGWLFHNLKTIKEHLEGSGYLFSYSGDTDCLHTVCNSSACRGSSLSTVALISQ